MNGLIAASLLIVTSMNSWQKPEWKGVCQALKAKHADMEVSTLLAAPAITDAAEGIKERPHDYVAFVMQPEEVNFRSCLALNRMMRRLDDDPYDDAIWSVVTGPDANAALRIATSTEPRRITTCLATTGVGADLVAGKVACFSDANPPGTWWAKDAAGRIETHTNVTDFTAAFRAQWAAVDPELILTSSHATQFNLEMPFSRGNLFSWEFMGMKAPLREKIWIAAGNCLIADNKKYTGGGRSGPPPIGRSGPPPTGTPPTMIMMALGWGKCNQFMGYLATTWFGAIGWDTWRRFAAELKPLNQSYFEARHQVDEELAALVTNLQDFHPDFKDADDYERMFREVQAFRFKCTKPLDSVEAQKRLVGLLWDRDATILYGDPAQEYGLRRAQP